jgi:hypothetical protein
MAGRMKQFERHVHEFCVMCENVTLRVLFCLSSLYGMFQAFRALLN